MRKSIWWMSLTTAGLLLGVAGWARPGQQPAPSANDGTKTAAQQFKNIQVLKDIPADQLIPAMQFISASLGVECEFCHVEHQMEKDDKKEKQAARKMISMMQAINAANFNGDREVTCYTCHRGAAHPVGTPLIPVDGKPPVPHVHAAEGEAPKLPAPEAIFDKYLSAVGGADAVLKVKTRVQKGTIDVFGQKVPIVVYSEGPDKRVSITQQPTGPSVTAYNGTTGWLSMPNGFHLMRPAEQQAASLDAQLYFPVRVKELYGKYRVRAGEEIGGRPTLVVAADSTDRPSVRLYFDAETGLLLRQIRYAETPLGRNPTQIDYADYRAIEGVKIPYRWTLGRPTGSFTIQIDQVEQNVAIDPAIFMIPKQEEKH